MPYDDIADLIASLRYHRSQGVYHRAAEAASNIASLRKYHREEAINAASRCDSIIRTLNANMQTGIDPDAVWPHWGEQIDAFLGAQADETAA